MSDSRDKRPKRRLQRRPLPAKTPAMAKWMEYGIADLEDFANGDSQRKLRKDTD